MKKYITTDGETITKQGRAKKIYLDAKGAFFVWNGRRKRMENVPRLSYPIMYEDERGKLGVIGGYITLCNMGGVFVEIDPNGEAVQLWEV